MVIEEEAQGEGEEGENYFVSMTDMMVGVLFIFIIMLMGFALNFQKQTDNQTDKIVVAEEVGRQLQELEQKVSSRIEQIQVANATRNRLLRDLRDQLRQEGLVVQVDEANGVLRLSEDAVRFPPDRAELAGRAKENVGKIARVLSRVLPAYSACREDQAPGCQTSSEAAVETVFLEGHTDTTGQDERNWSLSTERAVNTFRELASVAPDLRRLRNRRGQEVVSVSGYSSTRQIDPERNTAAYEKNRRIDLRFVMELDNTAGLREIQRLVEGMKDEIGKLSRPAAP
jgi:flagellar motor protein MotB